MYIYVKYFNNARSQQILVAHISNQWEYTLSKKKNFFP